jgi:tetratricopeptide (TPR) repeat protein
VPRDVQAVPSEGVWARAWQKARDGFAELERTVHRPPPNNKIPGRTALVLVALAGLQGLLLALGFYAFRKLDTWWSGETPITVASAAPVLAAKPPRVEPVPAPPKRAESPPPASATTALPAAAPLDADGSDQRVIDCDALLAADPPPEGYYPGAAYQQTREGRLAVVRGNLQAAQAAFCKAERWDRENPAMPTQLAHVFLLRRDGAQVVKWARRALELDADIAKAKELLGDGLGRLGKSAEARRYWYEAAGLNPMLPEEVRGLLTRELRQAEQAQKSKDFIAAERFFRRAALLAPENVAGLVGLAATLVRLGDAQAAALWGRRAVEVAPRNVEARVAFGDALARSGEPKLARAEWREASLLDPTHRGARKRLQTSQ